jgi:hypothetical protein
VKIFIHDWRINITLGRGGIAQRFLTSALDGGKWSVSSLCHFTSGDTKPGTHWIRGWVGLRAGADAKREIKISCREPNPGRLAHSLSLYWLKYPGSYSLQWNNLFLPWRPSLLSVHVHKGFHSSQCTADKINNKRLKTLWVLLSN